MLFIFAEALVVLVLGCIGAALYATSRELERKPVSADAVVVDLLLGLVAVWVFVLLLGLTSRAVA